MLQGIWDVWNNPDMSGTERIMATITSLIPIIMTLTTAFSSNNIVAIRSFGAHIMSALGYSTEAIAA
jgi:hypothetical protein